MCESLFIYISSSNPSATATTTPKTVPTNSTVTEFGIIIAILTAIKSAMTDSPPTAAIPPISVPMLF